MKAGDFFVIDKILYEIKNTDTTKSSDVTASVCSNKFSATTYKLF